MSAIARSTVDWPARLAYEAGWNKDLKTGKVLGEEED